MSEYGEHFHLNSLAYAPVSDKRLNNVLLETENDATMRQLREYASTSWPDSKDDVTPELRSYWNFRDELHKENGMVLRSNGLFIPPKMRGDILFCTLRTREVKK